MSMTESKILSFSEAAEAKREADKKEDVQIRRATILGGLAVEGPMKAPGFDKR